MARAKSAEQTRTKSKTTAVDDINRGIEQLQQLMAQVEDLSREGFPYQDAVRARTELSLRETIRRIFGEKSEEYQSHKSHKLRISHRTESAQTTSMLKRLVSELEQRKLGLLGIKSVDAEPSPAIQRHPDKPLLKPLPAADQASITIAQPSPVTATGSPPTPSDAAMPQIAPPRECSGSEPIPPDKTSSPNLSCTIQPSMPKTPGLAAVPTPPASSKSDSRMASSLEEPQHAREGSVPETHISKAAATGSPAGSPESATTAVSSSMPFPIRDIPSEVPATESLVSAPSSDTSVSTSLQTMPDTPGTARDSAPVIPASEAAVAMPPLRVASEPPIDFPAGAGPALPVPMSGPSSVEVSPPPSTTEPTQTGATRRYHQAAQSEDHTVSSSTIGSVVCAPSSYHDDSLEALRRICCRFHLVVRQLRLRRDDRQTLEVEDEYDVQDLLYALLRLEFEEIATEDWCPRYAAGAARTDYLLRNANIVIIAKKTRTGLTVRDLTEQIKIDFAHYSERADCRTVMCFVYDPEGRIGNPRRLESDLTTVSDTQTLEVVISPK